MNNNLFQAIKNAKAIRFSKDIEVAQQEPAQNSIQGTTLYHSLAKNGLHIGRIVTPELYTSLERVLTRLSVPTESILAYVYRSVDIQAICCQLDSERALISFSSSLIQLLTLEEFEFVAAHEIGHFLLHHQAKQTNLGDFDLFQQFPAQEISADRVGLLGCSSIEAAIRALMKTACGLSEEHVRFNIGAYIDQIRNIDFSTSTLSESFTHPSMVIRVKALLWFSMYQKMQPQQNPSTKQKIDSQIERLLDRMMYLQQHNGQKMLNQYYLWYAVFLTIQDGILHKKEQRYLMEVCADIDEKEGNSTEHSYSKLIQYLRDIASVQEIKSITQVKVEIAKTSIQETFKHLADQEISRIEKIAQKKYTKHCSP